MSATARVLSALACAAAVACASSHGLRPLAASLPAGIPAAADRAGWERIAGDYDTASEHVRYALFVDPSRPLLFRITQFRVSRPAVAGGAALDDGEIVIWNEAPGAPVRLRCFREESVAGARPSPRAPRQWRDVSPATPEFVESMRRAIEIYGRVHQEGRAGPRPR